MSKRTEYSNEPINPEVVDDFLLSPEELAAIDRAWLEEVQRRSAEFDAGRMKSFPASDSEVARELTKVKRQVEAHDTVLVRVMDSMSERKSEHDTRSVPGSPEDEER